MFFNFSHPPHTTTTQTSMAAHVSCPFSNKTVGVTTEALLALRSSAAPGAVRVLPPRTPACVAFLRDVFRLGGAPDKMPIEVYSKAFSYFSLGMTELVGVFLALYTDSWAPICFTTFLGVTSFIVSSTFDAEVMRLMRARCAEGMYRASIRGSQ